MPTAPLLRVRDVHVWRTDARGGRATLLAGVDLAVADGEHWAVIGPNGAGKSTLLALLAAAAHPSSGAVEVLGRRLGDTDARALRALVGTVPDGLAERFGHRLSVREVVASGHEGRVVPSGRPHPEHVAERAARLIGEMGLAGLAARAFATCSRGERQRALLARALMPRPRLLVLDEAAAGLDLPGRETLIRALERLSAAEPGLASVSVAHHLEELPASTTHSLLLRQGRIVAAGPVEEALSAPALERCFGLEVALERVDGRFSARAARA